MKEEATVAVEGYDEHPRYSRGERIADAVVHGLGLTFGLAACVSLLIVLLPAADALRWLALGLYAAGLLAMLGCSALYNLAPPGRWKSHFRRLDHAAIFVMIAGTYTPFLLVAIQPLVTAVSLAGLVLLGVGGLLYSLGVVFHLWTRLPYQNAIWHAFVLAAAACHFSAVMAEVAVAG